VAVISDRTDQRLPPLSSLASVKRWTQPSGCELTSRHWRHLDIYACYKLLCGTRTVP